MTDTYLVNSTDLDFADLVGSGTKKILTNGANSNLSDSAFDYITKLPSLEELDLEWAVNITDKGVLKLLDLENLKYIDLTFCSKGSEVCIRKLTEQGITVKR